LAKLTDGLADHGLGLRGLGHVSDNTDGGTICHGVELIDELADAGLVPGHVVDAYEVASAGQASGGGPITARKSQ
jgi:hypothetical protein